VVGQDFDTAYALSWTPDGKQLTFSAFSIKDSKNGIWLVDTNSVEPPVFLSDRFELASADGKIAIPGTDPSTHADTLYIHNIATSDETKIFSGSGIGISKLSWSSDGSKLVFLYQKSDGGNYGIYVFDANKKTTIQVTPDGDVMHPSFSPDGTMIAYTKGIPNSIAPTNILHIVKSDGSCDVEVPGHFNVWSPVWSLDGKQIAYIGDGNGIFLLDLVGAFGEDIVEKGLPCS
jgi:Tol biopolymer transport system component